jgi:DNA-binding CsgD family transcriptional regulator
MFEISPAEYKVLELISQGLNRREVAEQLFLSMRTVDSHLQAISDEVESRGFRRGIRQAIILFNKSPSDFLIVENRRCGQTDITKLILKLLSQRIPNKIIVERLDVSYHTVTNLKKTITSFSCLPYLKEIKNNGRKSKSYTRIY